MVTVDAQQLERASQILSGIPRGVEKAASRAINRGLAKARTEAVKAVRGEYNVKAGAVRKTIKIRKATPTNPAGAAISTGHMIPLIEFGPRPSTPGTGGPGRPVLRATVRRGQTETVRGGFVARMKSGSVGVYQRTTRERHPIEQKFGPAIPIMMGAADVVQHVEEEAQATVGRRFDHEVNRLFEGAS